MYIDFLYGRIAFAKNIHTDICTYRYSDLKAEMIKNSKAKNK